MSPGYCHLVKAPGKNKRVPICFGIFYRFVLGFVPGFSVLELAGAISLGSSVV